MLLILLLITSIIRTRGFKLLSIWRYFSFWKKKKWDVCSRKILSKQTRNSQIGLDDDEADVKNIICPITLKPPPHHILLLCIRSKYYMKAHTHINRDYRLTDDLISHQIYSSSHKIKSFPARTIVCVCVLYANTRRIL